MKITEIKGRVTATFNKHFYSYMTKKYLFQLIEHLYNDCYTCACFWVAHQTLASM